MRAIKSHIQWTTLWNARIISNDIDIAAVHHANARIGPKDFNQSSHKFLFKGFIGHPDNETKYQILKITRITIGVIILQAFLLYRQKHLNIFKAKRLIN